MAMWTTFQHYLLACRGHLTFSLLSRLGHQVVAESIHVVSDGKALLARLGGDDSRRDGAESCGAGLEPNPASEAQPSISPEP